MRRRHPTSAWGLKRHLHLSCYRITEVLLAIQAACTSSAVLLFRL